MRRVVAITAVVLISGLIFAPLVILDVSSLGVPGVDLYPLWCWSLIAGGITAVTLLLYMVVYKKDIRTVLTEEPED